MTSVSAGLSSLTFPMFCAIGAALRKCTSLLKYAAITKYCASHDNGPGTAAAAAAVAAAAAAEQLDETVMLN